MSDLIEYIYNHRLSVPQLRRLSETQRAVLFGEIRRLYGDERGTTSDRSNLFSMQMEMRYSLPGHLAPWEEPEWEPPPLDLDAVDMDEQQRI